MRFNPVPLMAALLFISVASHGQLPSAKPEDERYRLSLKSGSFIPPKNITEAAIAEMNREAFRPGEKTFIIIQFESLPGATEKTALRHAGIDLLDYIPNNAYAATVAGSLSSTLLLRIKARAVIKLSPEQKLQPLLAASVSRASEMDAVKAMDLWISFPKAFSAESVNRELKIRDVEIISNEYIAYHIIAIRIAAGRIKELASLPFIDYVQLAPKEDMPLNNKSEASSKANVLRSMLPGGRDLDGAGVVIGVGDDSDPTRHIDFTGRLINRAANVGGSHGLHVMGTVGGAGIRQDLYTGFAPGSTIIAQRFSGILAYASAYVQDHGMVITNNSYGNVDECPELGSYDLISRALDQQAFQLPNLQHVFAVGNSGDSSCSPYPAGFGNVLAGYQPAKNIITVGNTDETGALFHNSSRGPVRDGRIKPEIVAQGTLVNSTIPTHFYGTNSGTSMSAPAVSGGLALLYQRYKQLHAGANPKNGLMKSLLCNGATDKGNSGPDYSYGFGFLNLLRSVTMLEQNNYFISSVSSGGSSTHNITIPAGSSIARMKVMLYWNDSAAAALAVNTLVNDLDLTVTDPSSTTHLPLVLNSLPANVNTPAAPGADHINNIEQVVIENPAPGNYSFSVAGTTIPFGGQHEYYLVFDTINVSTMLSYQIGNERLDAGDVVNIQWESYGNPANNFTLQYSIDNGANWINVAGGVNVAAGLRQLSWVVPAAVTNQALVKLIHNGTGIESISAPFTIIGVPTLTIAPVANQCEGYINFSWTAVAGATDYEVMLYRGFGEMEPVATTTATSYIIGGLSKDTTYWVTARARINGSPGRRAFALFRQPTNGNCAGTMSDRDLKIDAILSPAVSGRKFTSTELSNNVTITIRIENLDNTFTTGNIPVTYIVNNNPPVNETIIAPNIGARLSYNYTFTTPVNMSATGVYNLRVSVSYPGDPYSSNDTLAKSYKQLDNPFIDLTSDFIDDIESATIQAHTTPQTGLQGADRYDFSTTSAFGQIRTFINTGIAYSGSKAITLDADRFNAGGTTDSLTGTFNLQGYLTATDNIRLDFMYMHHNQLAHPANKVWIRGDDQKPWIEAFDLDANQEDAGVYKRSTSIELNHLLANAVPTQGFSSSMQVRWGQWGQIIASDHENGAGYTFDDIRLYQVTDDVQMLSIDTPVTASCGLDNMVPVQVTVRNSVGNAVNAVPVVFQVDGGAPVTEIIPTIAGNTSFQYLFTARADLSAQGYHTLKVWVALPSDSFNDNDTVQIVLFNAPLITSFPYLQNFELDEGAWHTAGKKVSWQYGTPVSTAINRAASGTKAWKTNLGGLYNNQEHSYLISPCFNVTGMTNPTLSFSLALDLEDCGTSLCDAAYVEYSADGDTWTRLGAVGAGTNWYDKNYSGSHVWSTQNYTRWHVATIPLPAGLDRLRIRFVLESDPAVSREGIAIDDIHIYDSIYSIYDGPPFTSPVVNQAALNGNAWVDFVSGGKIIASVNPNNQNMGNTDVQAFIHTGATRVNSRQYYHNRNITIKPANPNLADSATVRFYFLDTESESLINATGCGNCTKPASAYDLGVTKYSNANDALENGDLADNTGGTWSFILPADVVIVPFDKGYYAEFNVKDFSEFWLNNGGPANDQPLPVELVDFTVQKRQDGEVKLSWATANENNTARFEIELARGNESLRQNKFETIGIVASQGNSGSRQEYAFTDQENNKQGVRYYRLKIVDLDGQFAYSPIRSVVFDDEIKWQVYPNPSTGVFNVVYQANPGEKVIVKIHDINGRLIRELHRSADGFIQKLVVDMSGQAGQGMYLLEISAGEKKQAFRILKQ